MTEPVTLDNTAQPAVQPAHKGRLGLFVILLIIVNFIWSGQAIAVKYIEPFLRPLPIAFLPFLIITPLMIPMLFRKRSTPAVRPGAADWMRFIVAGVAGQAVCMAGMTWGMSVGLASNCAILYLLIPVLTAVLASAMLHERVTKLRVLCLGIGLAGVLLMSVDSLRTASLDSKYLRGNLLMLVGVIGACFYNVYCKGLMEKFNELDILIYSYITATPTGLLILLWQEPDCFGHLAQLDTRAWMSLFFLALLVYGISMMMFFYVLKFLPVTVVLLSTYLVPVFGVILAMILLGERLSGLAMAGSGVVLLSTILIMKYDAAKAVKAAG